jgi:hypothetical protein
MKPLCSFKTFINMYVSRYSVSPKGWASEKSWFDSQEKQTIYPFQGVQTDSVANLASWSMGTGFISLGQMCQGVKLTTHLHSGEVKNEWSHTYTPSHNFMVCRGQLLYQNARCYILNYIGMFYGRRSSSQFYWEIFTEYNKNDRSLIQICILK